MNKLLFLLLTVSAAYSQITYPVNPNDRFTFQLGTNIVHGKKWPRGDLMEITGADTNLMIFREIIAPIPEHDEATEKLFDAQWTYDTNAQTATFTYSVVPLSAEELATVAALADLATKRQQLTNAIATLRTWAVQGASTTVTSNNVVQVTQTMATRMGILCDRLADFLEVEKP